MVEEEQDEGEMKAGSNSNSKVPRVWSRLLLTMEIQYVVVVAKPCHVLSTNLIVARLSIIAVSSEHLLLTI